MTGGAVSISLIAVIGLFILIGWRGLSFFWPGSVYEFDMLDKQGGHYTLIGEIYDVETVSTEQLIDAGISGLEGKPETLERYLIKIGNREYVDLDFQWVLETIISATSKPKDIVVFERSKNGNFYGYIEDILQQGRSVNVEQTSFKEQLQIRLARADALKNQQLELLNGEISSINFALEKIRLKKRKLDLEGLLNEQNILELNAQNEKLTDKYLALEEQLFSYRKQAQRDSVVVRDMTGREVTLPLSELIDFYLPNDMSFSAKVQHWLHQAGKFVSDDPREANTEGGVFPAIFGTVFMVMLMAVMVTPFGVVAAIYLHEYAGKNNLTKFIRIAVINLAGVPSIVYGVFGLGFFVYIIGGSIDQLFYPEALPAPTFGSPGVLWSALTLAILTLPVVIVSTEEGLSRIPSSLREGSLALGATKSETLWRIVVPMASPAIMTGLILAVARAAGEVAPLMLVGVVKMAPALPVDANFPFLHLDRKFMHLGFHIYDVGFQSPNVEAARPLVYATSFLLVTVIIGLNLAAIAIRNNLREKYRALEH